MVQSSAAGVRRASAALQPREATESGGSGAESVVAEPNAGAARALHERLVAFVHAVAGDPGRAGDVWLEHSYARARDVPGDARELLAPRPQPDAGDVDVERLDPEPPPALDTPLDDDDDYIHDEDAADDWEAKVAALAPSATHARLATAAADILRRLRLARLAGAGAEATRQAARRLRLALAPLWAMPGAPPLKPAAWLNAALLAHLPRSLKRLYDDMISQLRRTTPRLTERLMLGRLPPAADEPLGAVGPALEAGAAGPLLVWVGAGPGAADARWTRRLRALLYTRELRAAASAAPDAWCAQTAAALRADLHDAVVDAGDRGVVVCGCGGGAALAVALLSAGAGGASRVRGCVLLAPPLLTAEGGWALRELRAPALLVAGTAAARAWRGAARAAAGARRRLLLVSGADDALRLPYRHRARLRMPQHALDAAIVDEVYRWALEAGEARSRSPSPGAGAEPAPALDDKSPDEPAPVAVMTARSNRSIEIVEGRVVTRVSGSTPLALLPPRRSRREERAERSERSERSERGERSERNECSEMPTAADILHMPIVFADDESTLPAPAPAPAPALAPAPAPAPLTVTSGDPRGGRITRVIVASRGRGAGARLHARRDALVLRRKD